MEHSLAEVVRIQEASRLVCRHERVNGSNIAGVIETISWKRNDTLGELRFIPPSRLAVTNVTLPSRLKRASFVMPWSSNWGENALAIV